jgi:hypothetical protein
MSPLMNYSPPSQLLVHIHMCGMEYSITSKTVTVSGQRKPVSHGKCSDCLGLRSKQQQAHLSSLGGGLRRLYCVYWLRVAQWCRHMLKAETVNYSLVH